MGCYYGFEKRANEAATHRINKFAYANGTGTRRARNRRKPLRTKALTPQTAALAYANPARGDVSPLQPARSDAACARTLALAILKRERVEQRLYLGHAERLLEQLAQRLPLRLREIDHDAATVIPEHEPSLGPPALSESGEPGPVPWSIRHKIRNHRGKLTNDRVRRQRVADVFRRHLEKHGNVSLVGPDDRKPEPLDLDRRDRSGGTEEEVRAVRTDRTFFPEPMAASCQAPQRVPVRLESAISGFDSRRALGAQSHMKPEASSAAGEPM